MNNLRVRADEVIAAALGGAAAGAAAGSPLAPLSLYFPGAAALAGALAAAALAARQPEIEHKRGARYYPQPTAAKSALQAQEGPDADGITIGGVCLSKTREVGHFYVLGLPGAGKTVLLSSVLQQVLSRGDAILLHDPKGDYTTHTPNALLLGPWDNRAAIWAVGDDINTPPRAQEFARILIGEQGLRGENAFFYNAARQLLAALVRSLPPDWGWADLHQALCLPPDQLARQAASSDPQIMQVLPSLTSLGGEASTAEKGILATLAERTAWIAQMAAVDNPARQRISLRNWLKAPAAPLVLNNNANYATAASALFGAALAIIADYIASPDMPEKPASSPGLWVILDEMPQLGPAAFPAIQKIEEIGRSRGVRVIRAQQDESQLAALVGREKAAPMLAMQSTKIYCKVSDLTAAAIAQRIGEREIIRYSTTAQSGAVAGKTATPDRQPVISPADLMGLAITPDGPEIIMQIGDVLGKLVQPFPPKPTATQPPFVESPEWRDGISAVKSPELSALDEVLS